MKMIIRRPLCMSGSNWSGCSRTGTHSSTLWQNWKSSGRSRQTCLCPTSLPTGSLAMGSAPRSGPALKNFWIANTKERMACGHDEQ